MEEAVLVTVTTLDFPFSSVMISSSLNYFFLRLRMTVLTTTGILFHLVD